MADAVFDIVAMGDAIVDVIATCDEQFLIDHDLPKGSMQLLTPDHAERLYAAMGGARETSGGSAANSMAGVAAMGGRSAFIGQVADDQLGAIFTHDMRALGVHFDTAPLADGLPTGRCLILVTPDAQRTMNTSPGASHELSEQRIDEELIAASSILYLEGYLFGPAKPRAAMMRAIEIAHRSGRKVAFTLSESVCIAERREGFGKMVDAGGVDLLFANEDEALQLTGRGDLDAALAELSAKVPTLVITRGPAGALAVQGGETVRIPAMPVPRVVDTTGAGDLFAAGYLVAHCKGAPIAKCLSTGAIAAAEVISHFGARPEADLKEWIDL
ncbi:adenosine kinase [Sphingomonas rhizophila]|uniref:Adenosine kinase n=1 Tax=Sphingomonas rhizophila TaxID=2071607 RepID=A0A7G9SCR7_9SPHN|nr:adenosine kinase [Sphingomonas rhizophila]QNN65642.1 adenosine kinase [Sphingomonas rhizophila]